MGTCRWGAPIIVVLLALTGCGGPDVDESFAKLMQRPDIEQTVATYGEMSSKIRERLTAELGRSWEQDSDGSASGCGNEFDLGSDADIRHLPRWVSKGNLPDDQWPRAEVIVGEIVEGYGFGKAPAVIVDRQSDHEVVYKKPDGALVTFGTAVNTTLSIRTGCHLTERAHERGTPPRG